MFKIIICILCFTTTTYGGLLQLGRIIKYLNADARLLNLARYGNYCGPGGHGFPVDAVDRCCKAHDDCYSDVTDQLCNGLNPLLVPYQWTKQINRTIGCDRNANECSKRICDCDKVLSECFRDMSEVYREENLRGSKGLLGIFTSAYFLGKDTHP